MTTEATAILDGGDGGAPAAPAANGGGANPAANGSQPAAATNGQPWHMGSDYTDDDRSFMENKGWHKEPTPISPKVLKSYRHLETILAGKANAVILPKADDANGMTELMQKLGMPTEAKGYALPKSIPPDVAQNFNPKLVETFQGIAHKARLTNEQYGIVVAEHEAAVAAAEQAADVAYNAEVSRTKEKLVVEMGDQFGENVARGNLAMRQLGITPEERDKISEAMGVEKATRVLMKIGGFLAQHKAVGLDNSGKSADGFVTDKARAIDRIKTIKMLAGDAKGPDADFKRAMLDPGHPEHKNAQAQWREWNRVANSN